MPVQRSHNRPHPQVPRADELPRGVPESKPANHGRQVTGPQRGPDGKFLPGNALASEGGRRRKHVRKHLHQLGLEWLQGKPELTTARRRGNEQLKAEQNWVAASVGAGVLDPLAAAELRNAVTKETLAHLMLENPKMLKGDLGSTITLADKLLTAARGHRLTALELAARGAEARAGSNTNGTRLDIGSIDVTEELKALMAGTGTASNPTPKDEDDDDT